MIEVSNVCLKLKFQDHNQGNKDAGQSRSTPVVHRAFSLCAQFIYFNLEILAALNSEFSFETLSVRRL